MVRAFFVFLTERLGRCRGRSPAATCPSAACGKLEQFVRPLTLDAADAAECCVAR
jgi:hypothetical protein